LQKIAAKNEEIAAILSEKLRQIAQLMRE